MTTYVLGSSIPLAYAVTDETGEAASPTTAVLTVTKPDGTTATPTITEDPATVGLFELDYVPTVVGPHAAVFVTTGPAGAAATSFLVTSGALYPVSLAAVKTYLGGTANLSESDAEIQAAMDAEYAAQAVRCRIDPYTADLAEALKRRVARNLAARRVPLATYTAFEGGGGTSTRVPTNDAEITRLERPYRRMVAR